MCGIVGFVRPNNVVQNEKRSSFVSQGLYVDALRGVCGTGLAMAGHTGVHVFKRALQGSDFLSSLVYEKAKQRFYDCPVVIGHNRASTVGEALDENCHPFHFTGKEAEIVLVHNGTLHGYKTLVKEDLAFNHPVDSAWAAKAMSERPETDVLSELSGAFVLVWYNKTKNTFNVARNSFREIYWGFDKEGTLYFASEYLMIDWLAARNSIKIENRDAYASPADDEWYEFPLNAHTWAVGKPTVHKIKYKKKVVEVYEGSTRRGGTWDYNYADLSPIDRARKVTKNNTVFLKELEDLGINVDEDYFMEVTEFRPYVHGGYGSLLGTIDIIGSDDKRKKYPATVEGVSPAQWEEMKPVAGYLPVACIGTLTYRNGEKQDPALARCMVNTKDLEEFLRFDVGPLTSTMVVGAYGTLIPLSEWKEKAKAGCAFCSDPIDERDFKSLKWIETGEHGSRPMCHVCSVDNSRTTALQLGYRTIEEASKK